jgi:hypothetical protein
MLEPRKYFCPPTIDAVKQLEWAVKTQAAGFPVEFHNHAESIPCSLLGEEFISTQCWTSVGQGN